MYVAVFGVAHNGCQCGRQAAGLPRHGWCIAATAQLEALHR